MRAFLRYITLFINTVVVVALLTVYAGLYVNPSSFWYLSLPGLIYPVLIFVNIFFIFFWFFRKHRKLAYLSLFAVLIRIDLLLSFYQPFTKNEKPGPNSFKCLTYNVRNFGLYSWKSNSVIRSGIFKLIREQDPDILCVQEFFHSDKHGFVTVDSLINDGKLQQSFTFYNKKYKDQYWGMAIFTKYPILNKGDISFPNTSNNVIWVDLKIDQKIVRVYTCHLESYRITNDNITKINDFANSEEHIQEYESILRRLKIAFQKRGEQTDIFAEHITNCPYPVIITGDFNDTPWSYTYAKIKRAGGLKDAFRTTGSSLSGTYAGNLPSFRIDYLLYGKEFEAYNYNVEKTKLSDHFPVSCSFSFKE